jgi:hypothetical protein
MYMHPYVISLLCRVFYAFLYSTISAPLWHCNRVELLFLTTYFLNFKTMIEFLLLVKKYGKWFIL